MKKKLNEVKISNSAFKFLIVGCVNSGVGYLFMVLLSGIISPYFANLIAYILFFFISFYLHSNISFGVGKNKKEYFIPYLASYALAYFANLSALSIFIEYFSIDLFLSYFMSMIIFVTISFGLNYYFSHRIRCFVNQGVE